MARVSTNKTSYAYAEETSLGVAGTNWKTLEPNDIDRFGAEITTVARKPISKDRQRKKGTTTELTSGVGITSDLTMEHVLDFLSAFVMAEFNGPGVWGVHETNTITGVDGTTEEYDVSAGGALTEDDLIYCRGFTVAANNGIKEVATGSTATTIAVEEDVTDETTSGKYKARIEVCGFRTAIGDLDVASVVSTLVTLTSTALDFTTLGLTAGQVLWFGGALAINKFTNTENTGFGRVVSIAASTLVIDKTSQTWVTEANTTQLVDIYFGRFLRNVPVDDADFLETSFTFEGAYEDLEALGTPGYEYAKGNYCNQVTFQLPLSDKAIVVFAFDGTDTDVPTDTQKTGADTPLAPEQTTAFNTSADIGRLRITEVDETGLTTCFKTLNLTLNNNVSPENCLGTLGASFLNIGNFDVDVEAQVVFSNSAVPAAIRNNTTVTLDFSIRNDDGGLFFDLPSITLGDGTKELPENESVLINIPAQAFEDATLGTSIGISLFPYLPSS